MTIPHPRYHWTEIENTRRVTEDGRLISGGRATHHDNGAVTVEEWDNFEIVWSDGKNEYPFYAMKKPYRDWSHDDEDAPTGKGGAIMACMLIAVVATMAGFVAWNWDRIFNFFLP